MSKKKRKVDVYVIVLCVSGYRHNVVGLPPEYHGQISAEHGYVPVSVSRHQGEHVSEN